MAEAKAWTEKEDAILRSLYMTHTRKEIGEILGRSLGSVRKRCSVLGMNSKHPAVVDSEMEEIRRYYEANKEAALENFNLQRLANSLGRTKQFISRLAGKMCLTKKRDIGEEIRRKISEGVKNSIAENGHPKGMLGKKHTDEFRSMQSKRVKERVFTQEQMDARTEKANKTKIERYGTGNPTWLTSHNPFSRARRGKRPDLGNLFFRSAWEANYARFLNYLVGRGEILSWKFEPQTFIFHGETHGILSYTPDFKVFIPDGTHEWHEVKGWKTEKDEKIFKLMENYYPEEKIVLVDENRYKEISKLKDALPNWEKS